MKAEDIDQILLAAREVYPDIYRRMDAVARIIDPGAYLDGWTCADGNAKQVLRSKLRYQQAVALSKADKVLQFLGVNTSTDWLTVLDHLARTRTEE